MILDGYGLNSKDSGNAVAQAKTPVMDKLMAECPFVKGNASGMAVGLPDGQMGNSEVGHLNMGAGRIVYQELTRITKEIQDGTFFENPALLAAVENCKKNNSALHMMGLLYHCYSRSVKSLIRSPAVSTCCSTVSTEKAVVSLFSSIHPSLESSVKI